MVTLLRHIQRKTGHYKDTLHSQVEQAKKTGGAFSLQVKETSVAFATRVQHFLRGERHVTAAALIESPLCIQPGQRYALRIHLIGRDEPATEAGTKKEVPRAGLSALAQGEPVQIDVRTATSLAIEQRAEVCLPGSDYVAEVTLPMQSRSRSQHGQRERIYIYFMDKLCRPLYEKPFVIELFISPLVRPGREGHHALPIPL